MIAETSAALDQARMLADVLGDPDRRAALLEALEPPRPAETAPDPDDPATRDGLGAHLRRAGTWLVTMLGLFAAGFALMRATARNIRR